MQFEEAKSQKMKCSVCGKSIPRPITKGVKNYCSRVCASQAKYATRYKGTNSGPMDRPSLKDKTKLP
jgi:ribosome-binding protein aMBF1 (putative translation factor)